MIACNFGSPEIADSGRVIWEKMNVPRMNSTSKLVSHHSLEMFDATFAVFLVIHKCLRFAVATPPESESQKSFQVTVAITNFAVFGEFGRRFSFWIIGGFSSVLSLFPEIRPILGLLKNRAFTTTADFTDLTKCNKKRRAIQFATLCSICRDFEGVPMDYLFPSSRNLVSLLVLAACSYCGNSVHAESDGLVPAVVVRGEDSPNAQAIDVGLPGQRLPKSSSVSKVVNFKTAAGLRTSEQPAFIDLKPPARPYKSLLRSSAFEFSKVPANSTVASSAQPPAFSPKSTQPHVENRVASRIRSATAHLKNDGKPEVQQTQFMNPDSNFASQQIEHPGHVASEYQPGPFPQRTPTALQNRLRQAVCVADPAMASPEAYMAAPANDPTNVARVISETGSQHSMATSAIGPYMSQPMDPRFVVPQSQKPVVVRTSGLRPATVKKPAPRKKSSFPKLSLPFSKPSWLPGK